LGIRDSASGTRGSDFGDQMADKTFMNIYGERDHSIRKAESRLPRPDSRDPTPEHRTAGRILVIVEDLFFLAKIREAAKRSGIELESALPEQVVERLAESGYSLVVLDLNHRSGRAIAVLEAIKTNPSTQCVPVLGFLSHVQAELAASARASGCDVVMARSAFSQRLPETLAAYSKS
jgi:CheY-like chemotaxis protein